MTRAHVALASLGAMVFVAQRAGADASARLVFIRDAAATNACADETALRRAVEARLGCDPFLPWGGAAIVVRFERDGAGFAARVEMVSGGASRGARTLRSDDPHCAGLVELQIQQTEIWKQWCEIQPVFPYYNGGSVSMCGPLSGYACLPDGNTKGGTTDCEYEACGTTSWVKVDCGKFQLCSAGQTPCACTATGCTVTVGPKGDVAFDKQLASGALDGTVTGLDGQLHNVHLTR